MSEHEKANLFDRLRKGLEESIAYSKGELSLKTVTLPAPPPKAGADQITRLRKRFRMSQAVFAATLNVSPKTVQSWEQGVRQPADAALRMLQVIRDQPQVIPILFASKSVSSRHGAAGRGRRNRKLTKVAI